MSRRATSSLARVTAIVATMLACGAAPARDSAPPFMPSGEISDAPAGFVEMCARDTLLCDAGTRRLAGRAVADGPAPIFAELPGPPDLLASGDALFRQGTGALARGRVPREDIVRLPVVTRAAPSAGGAGDAMAMLRRINAKVNRTVVQVPDTVTAGTDEYWQRPTPGPELMGDCEDIAIEKRMRLIEAGFPAERLFFAVAYVRGFGLHTLLVARLDDGDHVLDSLSPHILPWSKVHYHWLRQQVAGDPLVWRRVGGSRPAETLVKAAPPVATAAIS